MDKMGKVIIGCIIVIIIIIIVIIGVLITMQNEKTNVVIDEYGNHMEQHDDEYIPDTNVKKVEDKNRYYIVKNIIDEYFNYINMINLNPTTELEKEDSDLTVSGLIKMYSENYIKEFNITNDNLTKKLEKYINCEYEIENMYGVEKSLSVNIYLIDLNILNTQENINLIIITDSANSAFEIYGDEYVKKYQYNSENKEKLVDINVEKLEQNSFNKIKSIRVTDEDIAINYFNDYKYKILNNIETAYNLLDEEYREKRFENINEYANYINENKEHFRDINIAQYLYNEYEDYTEYVCKDQHGNLYIFKETAIMDYTVQLDTYTITTDKFKEEYSKANDNKKVIMNVDKFVQMINNYDYKAAYKVLNNIFKENNFENEELFKEYMKNTYYRYNDIVINNFSSENNTYICKATITNKDNEEETKDMNIIMKLNQGTDFEMSFEII